MGLATRDSEVEKGFAGTGGYIAPELYKWWDGTVEDYDEKCDVWSIGMILLDLLLPAEFDMCGGGSAAYQALWTSELETDEEGDEGDTSKVVLRLGAGKVIDRFFCALPAVKVRPSHAYTNLRVGPSSSLTHVVGCLAAGRGIRRASRGFLATKDAGGGPAEKGFGP